MALQYLNNAPPMSSEVSRQLHRAGVGGLVRRIIRAGERSLMKITIVLLLAGICGFDSAAAWAQSNFYADKTINVVLGGPPAGSADLRTRAVVNILRRHIPGNPNIIVQY